MPRFAANLNFLFKELPYLDRFAAAAEAGFQAVEVLFPYDEPAHEITARLNRYELQMALINTPPPNWTGGARGFAAIPGGEKRFRHDFKRALRFAKALRAKHIHIMAGKAKGLVAKATYVENLKWAAAHDPTQSLLIEPINDTDMPGYFLNNFNLAFEVLDTVNSPNLGLQFDTYHAHIITGDVPKAWHRCAKRTRHIQIGGIPGRHEPVKGQVDYPEFFAALDLAGYKGFVSAEYHPKGRTEDGLGWMSAG